MVGLLLPPPSILEIGQEIQLVHVKRAMKRMGKLRVATAMMRTRTMRMREAKILAMQGETRL
jgi:hypothetical protein